MTTQELLEKYAAGERIFSGAYLSRAYLSDANLSRAYLSGAYLSRADLSGADLSGADLSGADYLERALGFAGFEIKTAIASADDMQAVLQAQGRGNVIEAEPTALPEPGLRERLGDLGHQLHMTEPEFRVFLHNHEIDGKVDLEAAVSDLEQRLEQHEKHMIALHEALAANPAD